MRPTGQREWPGLAKVGRGAQGARGVGGAAVSGGARTPLGGDESRQASSMGANLWWRRGGAPRRPLAAEPDRDGPRRMDTGGAGGAGHRGSGGPGPWWLWADVGETGQAPGLRLVRGGVEGPGGLGGEPREAPGGWARGSRGRSSVGRCRGAAEECSVGPRMGAAWGSAGARRGATQGRSSVGQRRGAAWGRVWAWHGAVKGRSSVGLRRGAAWD